MVYLPGQKINPNIDNQTMNKSNAILGGSPVRRQLCIVDSIWGMKKGSLGEPDTQLCSLIMGTFGPAVDYLTAKKNS